MHDRHSGVGVEVPAVYVEVQQENLAQPGADSNADVSSAGGRLGIGNVSCVELLAWPGNSHGGRPKN